MSEKFFQSMLECLERAAAGGGAAAVPEAELHAFFSDCSPEVKKVPAAGRIETPATETAPEQQTQPVKTAETSHCGDGLSELSAAVAGCRQCRLERFRHNTVFGEGNPHAELMFIGEGPGYDEDMQGRPFVGKAGQLLDKMIAAMKYDRGDVYIANIVKCRPPDNRVPQPDEAAACLPYLKRQIELVAPKVIVTLGKTPLLYLLGRNAPITRVRGQWEKYGEIPVMPTFHPAYLLRQESAKRDVWNDLKQVMRFLGKI